MTLAEIKNKKLTCVVHTKSKAEAKILIEYMPQLSWGDSPLDYWDNYAEETGYYIVDGRVNQFSLMSFYKNKYPCYGEIYEFSELFPVGSTMICGNRVYQRTESGITNAPYLDLSYSIPSTNSGEFAEKISKELAEKFNAFPNDGISAKNGGKNSMKFTFYVTEGTRVDKSCNGTIPTMTTEVLINGKDYQYSGSATCDKTDYEEREGVLNAIANAVCGGNFDREFNKVIKNKAFANKKARTCAYCGQLFDTVEEKQKHEAWHVERKKARRERYLLRKRAKEIAFEEAAQKMAKEMIKEDK